MIELKNFKKWVSLIPNHYTLFTICCILCSWACHNNNEDNTTTLQPPKNLSFEVVKRYPHNTEAFTEGLQFYNNKLIESTGLVGHSFIQETNLNTNQSDIKKRLNNDLFGEGICVFNDKLYQLTWQNQIAFEYAYPSYKLLQKFTINYEGWGMTHNNQYLIISDGTPVIRYVNPNNFNVEKTIVVHDNLGNINYINELEYVDGLIYANHWQTNDILQIDSTGLVIGKMDMNWLANEAIQADPQADVLNGIAYNTQTKTFFVTGKKWPFLYEIKIK